MENNNKEIEIITTEKYIDKNDTENNKNKKYDESRVYYVYKHVRLDNNTCFYIGKGKNGRKDVPNRNPTHDSICDRHDYKVVIFKDKLNEAEAFKLEEDLIRCYVFKMGYGICIKGYMNNNNKFLTNRTFGGEGVTGMHHSEEAKQKISEKIAGENHPFYGKHHSEETKRKLKGRVPWNKGKKGLQCHSEETKQKIGEKNKGKKMSEEAKQKIGEKMKEIKNSEEAKRKVSEEKSKKVTCITTCETFDSIKEASYRYKVARSSISLCCIGKYKHAGKLNGVRLQWKYAEEDDNESKAV